jgi:hypothetical protein
MLNGMPIRLLTTLIALLCAMPVSSQQTVTVVGIEGDDTVPPSVLVDASIGALDGARLSGGIVASDYTNVTLNDLVQLVGCSGVEYSCLREVAATLETDLLVFGWVTAGDPNSLELTFFSTSGGDDGLVRTVELPQDGIADYIAVRTQAFLDGNIVMTVVADSGHDVRVDGSSVGAPPVTLMNLGPGTYDIEVVFEDGSRGSREVTMDAVDDYLYEIDPRSDRVAIGPGPSREPRERGESRPMRALGWTSVALGAGALGASVYFGSQVGQAQRDFDATPYQAEAAALADDGRKNARLSNISIAAGAGLIGVGVIALVLDSRSDDAEPSTVVGISPTHGGAHATIRWTR